MFLQMVSKVARMVTRRSCGTVRYGIRDAAAVFNMTRHGTVQYGMVRYGTVGRGTVRCGAIRRGRVQ